MTVIIFLIVLAVLIFVHELGHFLLARWNGIRVDAFKLGFGPKILEWGKGETKYGVNLIPFGGFVKIHGENPDDDSINGPDKARSFVHKNRWRQASVLVAGVLFNFLFAWVLYAGVFATGVTASTDGFEQYSAYFHNKKILITDVESGSPAEKAGLKIGDVLTGIDRLTNKINIIVNKDRSASIATSAPVISGGSKAILDIQNIINESAGDPLSFSYVRNGNTGTARINAVTGIVPNKYAIGIAMQEAVDLKLPILSAIYEGGHYTLVMTRDTAVGLYTFVANIFHGTADLTQVSGPVGIAGIVGDAANMGMSYLVLITAIISINLGVINLIPFPALDGGRILFVAIEGVIRKRISPKFTNVVNTVGFVLLMILMVVVTYKDIAKLIK